VKSAVTGSQLLSLAWLLNGFENCKIQLFNSEGVLKWAYFQKKKVEYPFKDISPILFTNTVVF